MKYLIKASSDDTVNEIQVNDNGQEFQYVTDEYSHIFEKNKSDICNGIKERVARTFSQTISDHQYAADLLDEVDKFIVPKNLFNCLTQTKMYLHGHGDMMKMYIVVYIKFPVYLIGAYMFASGKSASRIANNHYKEFLEFAKNRNYQNITSYVEVYVYDLYSNLLTEEKLVDTIDHALSSTYIVNTAYMTFMELVNPYDVEIKSKPETYSTSEYSKFLNIVNAFVEYCKTTYKPARKSKWMKLVDQLESESNNGINSIYEQTDSGTYIDKLAQKVESEIGVWGEPSTQGGSGEIVFHDADSDEQIARMDYSTYCDEILDLAIGSTSEKDFISSLKSYYGSIVD